VHGVKNFPHQVNQLDRFGLGLSVFSELAGTGSDLHDDGVVGDALARSGAYRFRAQSAGADVEELLVQEHAKSSSAQGTRTMARELRRTFEELALLEDVDGSLALTDDAHRLLEVEATSPEAHAIWRRAFHDLELADDDGVSHPYEIMLRLTGERPGIEKQLLGLALEAKNDSEAEFQRLLRLVDENPAKPAWDAIGVSRAQRANSIKILPPVAEQLRETDVVSGRAYLALPDPLEQRQERRRRSRGALRSRRRRYDRTRTRGRRPTTRQPSTRTYDPDLFAARYGAHEALLAAFDEVADQSLDRWEGDYDLVIAAENQLLLAEVKTIRGDAENQVRLALGQLLYYEYFDVRPDWPTAEVVRLLVVDESLDQELESFVDSHRIGVVTRRSGGLWSATRRARDDLAKLSIQL
jgi:hypothetical protein